MENFLQSNATYFFYLWDCSEILIRFNLQIQAFSQFVFKFLSLINKLPKSITVRSGCFIVEKEDPDTYDFFHHIYWEDFVSSFLKVEIGMHFDRNFYRFTCA